MNQEKTIKLLASINLLMLPVVVGLSFALESQLPPLLIDYLNHEWLRESTTTESVVIFVSVPVIFIHFVALFGVIYSKLWSRKLLLLSSIALYLITPFLGPYVEHGISATIDGLLSLILGALLALLYFGESAFNKSIQPTANGLPH